MIRVLFVSINDNGLALMADAYMKTLGGSLFFVKSAALNRGKFNKLLEEVMMEDRIDIAFMLNNNVMELLKEESKFSYLIYICKEDEVNKFPTFKLARNKIIWNMADPNTFTGTVEEKKNQLRLLRNQIKVAVARLIVEINARS
jgi:arsenate reductase (thioredoxin)